MSRSRHGLQLRAAAAGLLCLAACDSWHLSISSDGLLLVTVISDSDGPGFRTRVERIGPASDGDRVLEAAIPASGRAELGPLEAGRVRVTLMDIPRGCTVAGANPREVEIPADGSAALDFELNCRAEN